MQLIYRHIYILDDCRLPSRANVYVLKCSIYPLLKEEESYKKNEGGAKRRVFGLLGYGGTFLHPHWSAGGQDHLAVSKKKAEVGLVFCILPMRNLETASIVLDDNGAGWPQLVAFLLWLLKFLS